MEEPGNMEEPVLPAEVEGVPAVTGGVEWLKREECLGLDIRLPLPNDATLIKNCLISLDQKPDVCAELEIIFLGKLDDEGKIKIYSPAAHNSPWKGLRSYFLAKYVTSITPNDVGQALCSVPIGKYHGYGLRFSVNSWNSSGLELNIGVAHSAIDPSLERALFNSSLRSALSTKRHVGLARIMGKILGIEIVLYSDEAYIGRESFTKFFDKMKEMRMKPRHYRLKNEGLIPTLRPYQKEAVRFMIQRELRPDIKKTGLWTKYKLCEELYYFPNAGIFGKSDFILEPMEVKGGILADEMGLGKTVELLALILLVKRGGPKPSIGEDDDEETLCPIQATVDYLVSSVTANIEGEQELKNVTKVRTKRSVDIVCFNANASQHYPTKKRQRPPYIQIDPEIACTMCTVVCAASKVWWTKDLQESDKIFKCPTCITKKGHFRVGCTLIVVPNAIYMQWFEEIRRHVKDNVKIDLYQGVHREGYKHPEYLAQMDIVLVSYETLRRDFSYTAPSSTRSLRKRDYEERQFAPSPLTAIKWWRVCLDESQLVEGGQSIIAQMCSMLEANSRWCITGTPLRRSVNDLRGLLHFLTVYPYCMDQVWEKLFWYPYTNGDKSQIHNLVSQLFWRNSKDDVREQLGLQPRSYVHSSVAFSPLEERVYKAELDKSVEKIENALASKNLPNDVVLKKLSPRIFDNIWELLTRVRSTIVTSTVVDDTAATRKPYSPEMLFSLLHRTARVDLEDAQRSVIANRNALAGINWIYDDLQSAFKWYNRAWSVVKDAEKFNILMNLGGKDDLIFVEKQRPKTPDSADSEEVEELFSGGRPITIDALQIVHIIRSLFELDINEAGEFVEKENLKDYLVLAENRYLSRTLTDAITNLAQLKKTSQGTDFKHELSSFGWVSECISTISSSNYWSTQLNETLKQLTELRDVNGFPLYGNQLVAAFTKHSEYLMQQQSEIEEMADNIGRDVVFYMKKIGETPPALLCIMRCQHYAESTISLEEEMLLREKDEQFRMTKDMDTIGEIIATRCILCVFQRRLTMFEQKMTGFKTKTVAGGAVFPFEQACDVVKRLFSRVVSNGSERLKKINESHQNSAKWFQSVRDAIISGRDFFVSIQELAYRYLELEQCATRYAAGTVISLPTRRLSNRTEVKTFVGKQRDETIVRIHESVDRQNTSTMGKSVALIRYLHDVNFALPRECAICWGPITNEWMVFPCAHSVCVSCFKDLKKMEKGSPMLKCVTCRNVCPREGVSLVRSRKDRELDPIPEGSKFSAKTEALIQKIASILAKDKTSKILCFTSLARVEEAMEESFNVCKLPFVRVMKDHKNQKNLNKFKFDPDVRICLMHLNSGANGLNLTMASHVIFIEPIIHNSVEDQAIGRVDRFGQTRPITVHHFVVKNTIEEEILAISSNTDNSVNSWTLETFKGVFGIV